MSSYKTLIFFVVAMWTLIGGYYLLSDHKDPHEGHDHKNMTAKLSAGVRVEFEMLNEKPALNETLEVIAKIESLTYSGDFEYKFFMPKNTKLISPNREGIIQLENSNEIELKIQLTQSVQYDMKVHFEIRKPGSPNASMFTFSTMDFQKNKQEVEALQERKSSYEK